MTRVHVEKSISVQTPVSLQYRVVNVLWRNRDPARLQALETSELLSILGHSIPSSICSGQ